MVDYKNQIEEKELGSDQNGLEGGRLYGEFGNVLIGIRDHSHAH
jgi:hypothetical protein